VRAATEADRQLGESRRVNGKGEEKGEGAPVLGKEEEGELQGAGVRSREQGEGAGRRREEQGAGG
jgi:hypothetical protein